MIIDSIAFTTLTEPSGPPLRDIYLYICRYALIICGKKQIQ